jgi:hypothetical protein
MPNENNLKNREKTQFRTGEQQVEIARQGGIASGIARREKKTVQKILTEFLDTPALDNPQIAKLAAKMGLQGKESIKDLFTIVCTLNTLKTANLSDLERLTKLLGEQTEISDSSSEQQEKLLAAIAKAVQTDNDDN